MLEFPYPANEKERLTSLAGYQLMDSGEEKEFDEIATIASAICGIPIALITFIDEKRQWFKAHIGTDFTENLREISFCTHAIAGGEDIMIIEDATLDARFANNPMVTGPTKLVYYAGVPLINEDGYALGTICVLDQKKHTLSPVQIAGLKSLGRQIVDKIELKRKVAKLEEANQELINSNLLIQKFASMAAHDIKNPLANILLTSQLLKRGMDKNEDERSLKLIEVNISSTNALLSLVDEMLDYSRSPSQLIARKQKIKLKVLFERIKELLAAPENFAIEFHSDLEEIHYSSIAMEQILLNLISNAIRYNDKAKGWVKVILTEQEGSYQLKVEDNGIGIAEEHHQKIFENNFTLNIADRYKKKGTGIGLSTVKDLLYVLQGSIALNSTLGKGTSFVLELKK
ncbi:GAF domain-containing sensor histidine kinase [Pedobacter psychrodurus]|uniref:GAF domain-containing sensor histidine kinase n=1 Tax=Pedobacter psychrodurus TaxID=2530456 RepID=UPI00292F5931|nr:GAF domain-containing sensor histidine kinase [Pedobacter psychrodurus]